MEELTNVHVALNAAAQEEHIAESVPQKVVCSFKVEESTKKAAEEICRTNGTTIANFLRKCCQGLVSDYRR